MTGRRRTGGLTPDDEEIWSYVKQSVHPLRRADLQSMDDLGADAVAPTARRQAPDTTMTPEMPDLSRLAAPSNGKQRWQPLATTPAPRPKPTATPATFDKRRARGIAKGQVEIEGRLDLHGLRESEAHVRLRGFLRQAQAQGKRTVLVITGKGREADDPHAPYDFGHDRSPRGVLKRNVPRWLSEPELAPLVVSYTTAHTRHGGEGALYVHLRRA